METHGIQEELNKQWFRYKIRHTDTQCFLGQTPLQIDNGQFGFTVWGWTRFDNVGTFCITLTDKKTINNLIKNLEKLRDKCEYDTLSDIIL